MPLTYNGPAEDVTNNAFARMPTPDEVTVSVANGGIIKVLFSAMWKESVPGAAKAALFIDEGQMKVQAQVGVTGLDGAAGTGTPVRGPQAQQAASIDPGGSAGQYRPITSFGGGLAMLSGGNATWADSPLIVCQGAITDGTGPGVDETSGGYGGDSISFEVGRNPQSAVAADGYHVRQNLYGGHVGGECIIDNVPAGQHTISVRWLCTGGTVTAKARLLRAEAKVY